jgi:hypothetical protein
MSSSIPDAVLSQGKVGSQVAADGTYGGHRLSKTNALIIGQAHGKYYEAASRGKLFIASIGVAGVAPGTALSTAPALIIWNPVGSGLHVAIKQIFVSYISGTLGAGALVHAQNVSQLTAPSGGTELTPVASLLNGTRGSARAFTGSTISATSTIIRASMSMGAGLASTALFPSLVCDEVDGSIVVPAGVAYCYQGIAAAGTSPLLVLSAVYEEITLPS